MALHEHALRSRTCDAVRGRPKPTPEPTARLNPPELRRSSVDAASLPTCSHRERFALLVHPSNEWFRSGRHTRRVTRSGNDSAGSLFCALSARLIRSRRFATPAPSARDARCRAWWSCVRIGGWTHADRARVPAASDAAEGRRRSRGECIAQPRGSSRRILRNECLSLNDPSGQRPVRANRVRGGRPATRTAWYEPQVSGPVELMSPLQMMSQVVAWASRYLHPTSCRLSL